MFSNQPMILLLYKEACFNTDANEFCFPSVFLHLLQVGVIPREIAMGLQQLSGIQHILKEKEGIGIQTCNYKENKFHNKLENFVDVGPYVSYYLLMAMLKDHMMMTYNQMFLK